MPSTSMYLRDEVLAALAQYQRGGGDRSAAVTAIIERHAEVCRRELPRDWSRAEWMLVCDLFNGTLVEPITIAHLDHEIEDAIRLDHLAEKWKIDGDNFVARVRALCYGGRLAVCDLALRFWAASSRGEKAEDLLPAK
jgi:hypothetical protein